MKLKRWVFRDADTRGQLYRQLAVGLVIHANTAIPFRHHSNRVRRVLRSHRRTRKRGGQIMTGLTQALIVYSPLIAFAVLMTCVEIYKSIDRNP